MAIKGDHDDVLLPAHHGVSDGQNAEPPPRPQAGSVESAMRMEEPKFDEAGLSVVTDAELQALKDAGFEVQVGLRGGLSGHLKNS